MTGDGCSAACGYCNRCTLDEAHGLIRKCTDCGRPVWVGRDEDYTLQVFCGRCSRTSTAQQQLTDQHLAALSDQRRI